MCQSGWTTVHPFVLHIQNINLENPSDQKTSIYEESFYKIEALKTILKYKIVLSAFWLYCLSKNQDTVN